MAKQRQKDTGGLDGIAAAVRGQAGPEGQRGLPPVHLWDPPFCGDLDIRIASDGTWFYLGSPIGRQPLVRLFASVIKREGDKYFLVTPVEKIGIVVEDAPFLAVEMRSEAGPSGRRLHFRTNVDDWVACGPGHVLRFEPEESSGGLKPYLHVRRNLWAKVTRALFYDLVEMGDERDVDGERMFGIDSDGLFFPMARADALKDLI
jgi:hypothetical protein